MIRKIVGFLVALIALLAVFFQNIDTLLSFKEKHLPSNDVSLSVCLKTEPYDPKLDRHFYGIQYYEKKKNDGIEIIFNNDCMNQVQKGVGAPYFVLPKIGLDVKVVNNSKKVIYINEAVLDVLSSTPDFDPIMVFSQGDVIDPDEIQFTNDGWASPQNIRAYAMIKGIANRQSLIQLPLLRNESETYIFDIIPLLQPLGLPVGDIKYARALRIEKQKIYDELQLNKNAKDRIISKVSVKNLDLAIERLNNRLVEISDSLCVVWGRVQIPCVKKFKDRQNLEIKNMTKEELRQYPYNCLVDIDGYVEYEWLNEKGRLYSAKRNFSTSVFVTPAEGRGDAGFEPTGQYELLLKDKGSNYSISKQISQPIEPGKYDRFIVWIGGKKSSSHEFIMRLKYNDKGAALSPKIKLKYFMPKDNSARLHTL